MAKHIEKLVEDIVLEFIKNTDIELVDVEYIKERDWYLRVFIDKKGGIEIEDCQWLSENLEEKLDVLDPISDSYYLEVSSPGIDRTLKKDSDLERHKNDKVEIHTYAPIDGEKITIGILEDFSENEITIDGKKIARDKISKIKLHVEF